MKLLVISPEAADRREVDAVRAMIALGLKRYHVRKPAWTENQVSAWLQPFSEAERKIFIMHEHPALVKSLGLAGAHWRDDQEAPAEPPANFGIRSRACHDLKTVAAALGRYDSVLLSPVFPSLSKPGYGATRAWTDAEAKTLLVNRAATTLRTELYALGGVEPNKLETCQRLGFDGVAVLGAIWQAADPVAAFADFQSARDSLRAVNLNSLVDSSRQDLVAGTR